MTDTFPFGRTKEVRHGAKQRKPRAWFTRESDSIPNGGTRS